MPQPDRLQGQIVWMRILRGPFRLMAIAHDLGLLECIVGAGGWMLPASEPAVSHVKTRRSCPRSFSRAAYSAL